MPAMIENIIHIVTPGASHRKTCIREEFAVITRFHRAHATHAQTAKSACFAGSCPRGLFVAADEPRLWRISAFCWQRVSELKLACASRGRFLQLFAVGGFSFD